MNDFDINEDLDSYAFDEVPLPPEAVLEAQIKTIKKVDTSKGPSIVVSLVIEWQDENGDTCMHNEDMWLNVFAGKGADKWRVEQARKDLCSMLGGKMVKENGVTRMTGIGSLASHEGKFIQCKVVHSKGGDRVSIRDPRPSGRVPVTEDSEEVPF